MIELFPNPQLRLRAAPPIITGTVAIFIFVVKLPQANALLAGLAAIGLFALFEAVGLGEVDIRDEHTAQMPYRHVENDDGAEVGPSAA